MSIASILRRRGTMACTVPPTASITEVARLLAERRSGAVLVAEREPARRDQVLGIVSERDIVRSLAKVGAATLEMTAGQLMTRALRTAEPATTLHEAMGLMTAGRFRHLPVFEHGTLVGLVSLSEVVEILAREPMAA
ncbi:MAG: CBS domain-containing protein [Rhodospirillales bacterium]|jgi:CBS domain-containing protein|nr:CBS domain-containing protein [Rhodospirillales bacterium]